MSESIAGTTSQPRFWSIARRPRWIAALLLVLVVASVFAALGRWQLERSVLTSAGDEIDTETAVPLASLAEPGVPVTADEVGRLVTVEGAYDSGDPVVLASRQNRGETGYWAVARLLVAGGDGGEPVSLAVALGWAPTAEQARAAAPAPGEPVALRGRYLPSEPPRTEDLETGERSALSVAELVNLWPGYRGEVYAGYLILDAAPAGLATIDAPPPLPESSVNLLNLFYALEWVVFAGFALYLWYRLVKDEVEKEAEEAGEAAVPPPGPGASEPGDPASPRP